jgi:hypothetical protein
MINPAPIALINTQFTATASSLLLAAAAKSLCECRDAQAWTVCALKRFDR